MGRGETSENNKKTDNLLHNVYWSRRSGPEASSARGGGADDADLVQLREVDELVRARPGRLAQFRHRRDDSARVDESTLQALQRGGTLAGVVC